MRRGKVDDQRFDDIARLLASGVSRRSLVKRLGAGLAGAGLARLGTAGANAAPSPCNAFCADQPGPRGAQCRQACKACDIGPSGMCLNSMTGRFTCCGVGDVCLPNESCAQVCDPGVFGGCPAGCPCTGFASVEGAIHCIADPGGCDTLVQACSATVECPQGYQCQYTGCNGGEYRCVPLCGSI